MFTYFLFIWWPLIYRPCCLSEPEVFLVAMFDNLPILEDSHRGRGGNAQLGPGQLCTELCPYLGQVSNQTHTPGDHTASLKGQRVFKGAVSFWGLWGGQGPAMPADFTSQTWFTGHKVSAKEIWGHPG